MILFNPNTAVLTRINKPFVLSIIIFTVMRWKLFQSHLMKKKEFRQSTKELTILSELWGHVYSKPDRCPARVIYIDTPAPHSTHLSTCALTPPRFEKTKQS